MENRLSKALLVILLGVVLIFPFMQATKAQSTEATSSPTIPPGYKLTPGQPTPPPFTFEPLTEQQKLDEATAVAFLTNVADLDMSRYNITLGVVRHQPYNPNLPPPIVEETILCNVSNSQTRLNAEFFFRSNSTVWCEIDTVKGSPVFIHQTSSDISAAKGFIDRLQNISGTAYLPSMRSMLDSVSTLQNSSATTGDLTLKTSVKGTSATFIWSSATNGVPDNQKVFALTLQNGQFQFFADNWNLYKIGNADFNISKEQAIQIAKSYARNLSWTAGNITIANFNFANETPIVTLSMQDRGNYTLYPIWDILLPLDQTYPGLVTCIQGEVWADTGNTGYFTPSGGGGAPPTAQPTQSLTSSSELNLTEYSGITIAVTLIAIMAVASYLFYKRKR